MAEAQKELASAEKDLRFTEGELVRIAFERLHALSQERQDLLAQVQRFEREAASRLTEYIESWQLRLVESERVYADDAQLLERLRAEQRAAEAEVVALESSTMV
jgi:chromosome segregation ATPase